MLFYSTSALSPFWLEISDPLREKDYYGGFNLASVMPV